MRSKVILLVKRERATGQKYCIVKLSLKVNCFEFYCFKEVARGLPLLKVTVRDTSYVTFHYSPAVAYTLYKKYTMYTLPCSSKLRRQVYKVINLNIYPSFYCLLLID